jgi:hypothetical protein
MPVRSVQPVHDEPPYLSSDMNRADLIEVLAHLRYRLNRDQERCCLIEIEREVATYLIGLLRQH